MNVARESIPPRNETDHRTAAIRSFWDNRARVFGEQPQATLAEWALRRLEIQVMSRIVRRRRPRRVLDVGCGNGFSTKALAVKAPTIDFIGIDYSAEMIAQATSRPQPRCRFAVADVLDPDSLPPGRFDLIITQRCLQNLPDYEAQSMAIANLLAKREGGGGLALMECSKDGVDQLNRYRRWLGREPIEGIEPWHNCFLRDECLRRDFGVRIVYFSSTYMLLTRLVSERLATIASRLPSIGRFGYDRLYLIG